ncbi:MAG: hypothetical protein E7218_05095 [Anaerofustis stercorihominis]|nr:hypothetical protein [Anaerofustis stercorihominis]
MKKTDPRDTVYTSDAEDLRRRYLLERIKTGEEVNSSSPVYSSGHGINIDKNNVINIITADGISEGEDLPPSSADVYDAFVRTDKILNQLDVNLMTVQVAVDDFMDETQNEFVNLNQLISDFCESGKSGSLYYEKYADGRVHIWGTVKFTPTNSTATAGIYTSNQIQVDMGLYFSVQNAVVSGTVTTGYYYISNAGVKDGTTLFFRIVRTSAIATTAELSAQVSVWGTWS